jgi:DNA-binding LacI/PurR family transcriptional regulator
MVELLGDRAEQPAKVHAANASAGRLAAEHLLGCGLRNFGFFAYGEAWWIAAYRQGFEETITLHRFACTTYRPPRTNTRIWPKWRESMQPDIVAWLKSRPASSRLRLNMRVVCWAYAVT